MIKAAAVGKSPASLSAGFANIGPGNSPQSNADVTVTFSGGGTRKLRASLSGGTYGAGAAGFSVQVGGLTIDTDTPADGAVIEADISTTNTVHFTATKGGTGGTSWNASMTVTLDGQPLGSFTVNVTAP